LGSTRLLTKWDKSYDPADVYDYLPFGESNSTGSTTHKFTGKERDTESNLDYLVARYYRFSMGRFTSADSPFADQNPDFPQSWNLYSYVRNNPLKFADPTGEDCVYTQNYSSNGTVDIERGDCTKEGGTFVDGTIDLDSIRLGGNNTLEFGYTTSQGAVGVHSLALPSPPPSDQLRPEVASALRDAGDRASRDTSTFGISVGIFATAYVSTYAVPAAISAVQLARILAALKAAQEAWKRIPLEQRQSVTDWLSKIRPGAPPPGPLPPGANIEALKAYREIAVRIIEAGKDIVGTQRLRVEAIDRVLGR
jgi:RHS repeat-associated protein